MTGQEAEKKREQWPREGKGQCRHGLLELATANGGYVSENYYCVHCGEYFEAKQLSAQRNLINSLT